MGTRLTLLPDERFLPLHERLRERVREAASAIDAGNFRELLDPLMRVVLEDAFRASDAHEGSVWLADDAQEHLVVAFNTGQHAARLENAFRQPLSRGIISMVFRNGQPFCENDVYRNTSQDGTLDRSLDVLTCAMIAVPFGFANEVRGVISCVKLKPASSTESDPPAFSPLDLQYVQRVGATLSRLLDFHLVATTVGWNRR